jgi:SAM-dependent methyltransferase
MILTNAKNLFSEIFYFFKNIDFTKKIKNIKNSLKEMKDKINNLFETNLKNGLTHYYDGHYYDALIRFKLMNCMWRNNSIIQYNLGRAYFGLKNKDKARVHFNKASNLELKNENNLFIKYFLKKIDDVENIIYIPENLKKEFYNYNINAALNNQEIYKEKIKQIFDLYNRYIGSIVVEKGEENVSLLELGCFTGLQGILIRSEFRNIQLDGIDISENMIQKCQELKIEVQNGNSIDEIKVYNNIWEKEMHLFLNENIISIKENLNKKTELEKQIEEDINDENLQIITNFKGKLYDIIFSLESFSDFGELSVIIKLSEINLHLNGILIFSIPKSLNNEIQFSTLNDYFLYNKEYIENILKETKLDVIDFIEYDDHNNESKMMFILKKVS